MLRCVQLFETPGTVAWQAPLSMEFSRKAYWHGFPSIRDLPDPGIEPGSPALQADSLPSELLNVTNSKMEDRNFQKIIKYPIFFIIDPELPINYHKL